MKDLTSSVCTSEKTKELWLILPWNFKILLPSALKQDQNRTLPVSQHKVGLQHGFALREIIFRYCFVIA